MNDEQYDQLLADIRRIIRQELGLSNAPIAPEGPQGELMTARDVANALQCSTPHARILMKRGDIPTVQVGGKKYVTRAAFNALYS